MVFFEGLQDLLLEWLEGLAGWLEGLAGGWGWLFHLGL
jgi:hypothetical protein